MGNDRFDGIQAQTGMSPNLLTQRLKTMEDNGLIDRRVYQERPRRHAYCITDKARELVGMMLTLRLWGMRHCGLDPPAFQTWKAGALRGLARLRKIGPSAQPIVRQPSLTHIAQVCGGWTIKNPVNAKLRPWLAQVLEETPPTAEQHG
ncbi:DNA-binding MarR family transcriptional regulator [Paraburkholderia sp. GAS32]